MNVSYRSVITFVSLALISAFLSAPAIAQTDDITKVYLFLPSSQYSLMFDFTKDMNVKDFIKSMKAKDFVKFKLVTMENFSMFMTKDDTEIIYFWEWSRKLTKNEPDKSVRIYSFRIRIPDSKLSAKIQAQGLNNTILAYECLINVAVKDNKVDNVGINIDSLTRKASFKFAQDRTDVLYKPPHLDKPELLKNISPDVIYFYLNFGQLIKKNFVNSRQK